MSQILCQEIGTKWSRLLRLRLCEIGLKQLADTSGKNFIAIVYRPLMPRFLAK
ncbi:MAG: hypothetical protein ACI8XW_003238 [Gammaproteobacteria bacterium]